jgi:hypothetical protein
MSLKALKKKSLHFVAELDVLATVTNCSAVHQILPFLATSPWQTDFLPGLHFVA